MGIIANTGEEKEIRIKDIKNRRNSIFKSLFNAERLSFAIYFNLSITFVIK